MIIINKIFQFLAPLALLPVEGASRIKMSAAIVRKNKIITFGKNSYKSHPFQKKFGKNSDSIFLHAEISAIVQALKILDVKELATCDLYICRIKKNKFSLAKPCLGCARAIAEFKIKNVFYTTDDIDIGIL